METIEALKLLRMKDLEDITKLKRSTLYNKMNPHSKYFDEDFPKPISLSKNGKGAKAWLANELYRWIGNQAEMRF